MHAPSPPLAQALVLAAGRGQRMQPLTDHTPKPLLHVHGQALIAYPLQALARAGVQQVIINTAWLEGQFPSTLGGHFAGMQIRYSQEGQDSGGALETLGGISRALPLLDDIFWVAAGDIYAPDFVFDMHHCQALAQSDDLAHLFLVPNPGHNPKGDFPLTLDKARTENPALYTFSTYAVYKKAFFLSPYNSIAPGNPDHAKAPLAPLLRKGLAAGVVRTTLYTGAWTDVGTPARLAALNAV